MNYTTPFFRNPALLLAGASLLFILFVSSGCKNDDHDRTVKPWRSYVLPPSYSHVPPGSDTNQLVIWRAPGTSEESFNEWLDSITRKFGEVHISYFCQHCDDSTLMLLTGPGAIQYIQTGPVQGGSGSGVAGGPVGGDGPIYYSKNYTMAVPEYLDSIYNNPNASRIHPPDNGHDTGAAVTVAVFDTGLDSTDISSYVFDSPGPSCMGSKATRGWNFIGNSPNWYDDFKPLQHGTVVSWFIINQVKKYHQRQVKILPVKIDNSHGQGTLFGVLCGFAYAKDLKAKIINASFGFYSPRLDRSGAKVDSNVVLLKEYARHYLTNNNILLIAAAGNAGCLLDTISFYPASLSRELDNVIPVTTISPKGSNGLSKGQVSLDQNYSEQVVYAGVSGDGVNFAATTGPGAGAGSYLFYHPYLTAPNAQQTVHGSSFATPIVTGNICAHYSLVESLLSNQRATRRNILDTLITVRAAYLSPPSPTLQIQVNKRYSMNK